MATPGHGRGRGGNGRFTRTVDSVERDAEAARLRAQNLSFRQIAERLGYADDSGAVKAVSRALAQIPAPAVSELRSMSLRRLEYLMEKLQPGIDAGDVKSIAEARKVIESVRRMFGADGPLTVEMTVSDVRGEELAAMVAAAKSRLLEQMGAAGDDVE